MKRILVSALALAAFQASPVPVSAAECVWTGTTNRCPELALGAITTPVIRASAMNCERPNLNSPDLTSEQIRERGLDVTDVPITAIRLGTTTNAGHTDTIIGITKSNPAIVTTSAAHGLSDGDKEKISGVIGMTEVNGNTYTISSITSTTFALTGVDSTSFSTYVLGGSAANIIDDVLMVAGNSNNWYLRGNAHLNSLNAVSRPTYNPCTDGDCPSLLTSPFAHARSEFKGKIWVNSLRWLPSNGISASVGTDEMYAFMHEEYHGELEPAHKSDWLTDPNDECYYNRANPPIEGRKCWDASTIIGKVTVDGATNTPTSIGYAHDGGSPFKSRHVIAASPFRYVDGAYRRGAYSPRPIWAFHEAPGSRHMYTYVTTADRNDLDSSTPIRLGQCLLRSASNLNWRAGRNYATTAVYDKKVGSPYTHDDYVADNTVREPETVRDADYHCEQVPDLIGYNLMSVKWSTIYNKYLGIFDRRDLPVSGIASVTRDIVYRWSSDLIHWSADSAPLLSNIKTIEAAVAEGKMPRMYYSILDPSSTDPNFDTIDNALNMYWVQIHIQDADPSDEAQWTLVNGQRDLYRRVLNITCPSGTCTP